MKIALANLTGPAVTGVALVSDAGRDATYAHGETVRAAVTFSEPVAVTGTPRLKLDLGAGVVKWAEYAGGSGTAALVFAWKVAPGAMSASGVAVPANALAPGGGGIRAAARDKDAELAHGGLAADASHKVDGTLDTRAPRLSAMAVAGTKLTLSFDEAIDAAASPARGAFTVRKKTPGGAGKTVGLSGTPAIEGARVTLKLAEAVRETDTDVKVSYRKSGSGNRLRDAAGNEVAGFSDEPVVNVAGDTTPPTLVRGEIDGGTMTLYFSEPLDPNSVGGRFRVDMDYPNCDSPYYGSCGHTFNAAGPVQISGSTVTVGLNASVRGIPLLPREGVQSHRAQYHRPTGSTARGLRDLAGNEVRDTRIIYLNNLTGPPTVTGVEVSSETGADATYALGETIRVRVTFSEAVTVTGTPRLKIDFSTGAGGEKWADYESGSGTRTLELAYTVAASDVSAAGVAVLANTLSLNGGTIETALTAGESATLAHAGLAHDPNQRVAGGVPLALSVALSSDAGDDNTYVLGETIRARLTFSEAVDVTGVPRLKLDLSTGAGDEQWADYTGGSGAKVLEFAYTVAASDVSAGGVAVLANTLELNGGTIRSAATQADAHRAHAGLAHDPNHRVDTAPPMLSVASVNGAALKLTFDEALGAAASLANGAFTVKKTPRGGSEQTVSLTGTPAIDGAAATLTLATAVLATDTGVKVSYAKPTSETGNRLRDAVGNEAAGFADEAVSNVTGDTTPPQLVRGEIDGGTMTLYFSEALDPASVGGRFRVTVQHSNGTKYVTYAKGDVEINGNAVTVGLGSVFGVPLWAKAGEQQNRARYIRPTDSTARGLGDLAGNEVGNSRTITLNNITGPPTVTAVAVSSEAGNDAAYAQGDTIEVRLTFSEAVAVTGTPRVKIDLSTGAGDEKWADYMGGSGAKVLEFAYTVAASDVSAGGVAVLANTLALNGGTIESVLTAGENAALAHAGLAHDPKHRVAGVPLPLSVALSSNAESDQTYTRGETIRIRLTFSEAVAVTGVPRLKIDFSTGAGDEKWADYESGSGTTMLEFAYTVAQGDGSNAGIAVLANTLALNGGTIRSAATQADAHRAHAGLAHAPNHRVDMPPRLVRGEIDGGTMTLYFSEALDPDSVGGQFVMFVHLTVIHQRGFYATGDVEIDGNKVTVGMGEGNPRAQPGLFANTRYVAPAAKGLRDLAGNPVASTRAILLDNLTGVAPAVTGVAVSSDAGADATNAQGETIRVRLTFNKTVNVTGTPRLRIDFSTGAGDERWADYASGSGTKALEFAYTVAALDVSAGGVAVLANTLALNGGTIESALTAGESAALAHAGLGHDTNHKVDGTASSDGGAVGNSGPRGLSRDGGPASVTGVAVVSNPASGDTYLLGRDNPCPGELRRGGFGDRHSRAQDRHGPGGVGREAGGLRERQRDEDPHLRPRGGGAEPLDAGDRGAGGHAGARRRHHPLGGDGDERGACPQRSRARLRPQGGLALGGLGGGRAGERGRGLDLVRGELEPRLHEQRAPGDGGLRDGRRHGDGGRGLHGDERHADLRRGRVLEDGERAGPRRRSRRGRGDVHADALDRGRRARRRSRGDRHHRERRPAAEDVAVALRAHGGGPCDGGGLRPAVGSAHGRAGDDGRPACRPCGDAGRRVAWPDPHLDRADHGRPVAAGVRGR